MPSATATAAHAGPPSGQSQFLLRTLRQAPRLHARPRLTAANSAAAIAPPMPKARLVEVIDRSRALLGMPADWRLAIVPASDTGAVEMALWSLLGARGVDVLAFESFSEGWATDVVKPAQARRCPRPDSAVRAASRPRSGRFRARRGVHLERHHVGRARARTATGSPPIARASRSATPPRPPSRCRCLGQARCRHLVLAEGAGRRGGARHAGAVAARRRPPGKLQARLAAAENLPADQGRQADRRHLPGRDHQHAFHALRRGRARRAALGRSGSAACRR